MLKRLATFVATLSIGIFSVMLFDNASASAATCTYGGPTGGAFSDSDNWSGCSVPQDGDSVVIYPQPGQGTITVNMDISGLDVASLSAGGGEVIVDTENTLGITGGISVLGDSELKIVGLGVNIHSGGGAAGQTKEFWVGSGAALNINVDVLTLSNSPHIIISNTQYDQLDASSSTSLPSVDILTAYGGGEDAKITIKGLKANLNLLGGPKDIAFEFEKSVLGVWPGLALTNPSSGATLTFINSQILSSPSSGFIGDTSLPDNMTIQGNLFGATGNAAAGKEAIVISDINGETGNLTFSGRVTLISDILVNPKAGNIIFSGSLHGNFLISTPKAFDGNNHVVVNASPNNSQIPNGKWKVMSKDTTITDNKADEDLYVETGQTVTINGQRGNIVLEEGAILKGAGKVGNITIMSGGRVAPGASPGCLAAGNTTFNDGSHFDVELAGTTVCSDYDQLRVTGTVNLGNANLNTSFLNSFKPKSGDSFTILDNDGTDAITGTFKDLSEGATFTVDGVVFKVSYTGGDGNDVVLTVQSVPGSPNTGMQLLTSNPLLTLALTTLSAVGLFVLARKYGVVSRG